MSILPERSISMDDLVDYNWKVSKHLDFIEAAGSMCIRHARYLVARPSFESRAYDELVTAQRVLESALAKVIEAQMVYEAKEVVR